MIKVFTAFKLPVAEPTCPGNPIRPTYQKAYHPDGSAYLVETGKENTDELIQSALETVSLPSLYQRFINGDAEAFNVVGNGFYADVSMIKDINDLIALQKRIENQLVALDHVDQTGSEPSVEKAATENVKE